MKKIIGIFLLGLLGLSVQGQQLQTGLDSLSYALGRDIARSVNSMGVDVNAELLSKSLLDGLKGSQSLIKDEDIQPLIRQKLMAIQEEKNAELKQASLDYMEANKQKPGVVVDSSGIQYTVISVGTGEKPTLQDTVTVHYAGTLTDGDTFDSSYERGEPISLSLDRVIKGWQIALPLMPKGSKYRFYIPYNLAYGESGNGRIPAYSNLIFDIELLDIKKQEQSEEQ